ncbi:ubiquitin-like protein ATG12 [Oncorhynchus tshawytscha]|uniref:Ubiquitin-like protein ATG12 n=1 Tax=Oncorhynchus tshawytscha TaxID=74940 RepID=A0A8C8IY07_ONCTS|nr:ubiquitin-like protein ATG12 [Oncorhynchus tshawytscha]
MSDNAESPTETQKDEPSTPQQPTEDSGMADDKKKIDVLLKAVGDTPIMKTKKWSVEKGRTVQSLSQFISRFLKMEANEQLFIYVNQSFSPSPDQEVGVLFQCFGSDGKLVLHYCKSQAWG